MDKKVVKYRVEEVLEWSGRIGNYTMSLTRLAKWTGLQETGLTADLGSHTFNTMTVIPSGRGTTGFHLSRKEKEGGGRE